MENTEEIVRRLEMKAQEARENMYAHEVMAKEFADEAKRYKLRIKMLRENIDFHEERAKKASEMHDFYTRVESTRELHDSKKQLNSILEKLAAAQENFCREDRLTKKSRNRLINLQHNIDKLRQIRCED